MRSDVVWMVNKRFNVPVLHEGTWSGLANEVKTMNTEFIISSVVSI